MHLLSNLPLRQQRLPGRPEHRYTTPLYFSFVLVLVVVALGHPNLRGQHHNLGDARLVPKFIRPGRFE